VATREEQKEITKPFNHFCDNARRFLSALFLRVSFSPSRSEQSRWISAESALVEFEKGRRACHNCSHLMSKLGFFSIYWRLLSSSSDYQLGPT